MTEAVDQVPLDECADIVRQQQRMVFSIALPTRRAGWEIMRRATAGLWPLLLLVGVAAASAGQNPPASADGQKLEAAWASLRARNARDYAIATPNGIDDARYVEVGGLEQWITIRGEDRNNPVLLFLHGGPGDATNPWATPGSGCG